jgi:hypothetical protein
MRYVHRVQLTPRLLALLSLSLIACDVADTPEPTSVEGPIESATAADEAAGSSGSGAPERPSVAPGAVQIPGYESAPLPGLSTPGSAHDPSSEPAGSIAVVAPVRAAIELDAGSAPSAVLDAALIAPASPPTSAALPSAAPLPEPAIRSDAGALTPAQEEELFELRRRATRISIPSSSADVQLKAALVAEGRGTDRIGAIDMQGGVGSIEIAGAKVQALAYAPVDWTEAGYQLYQTLAVARDRLFVIWFYCADQRLTGIYSEGTEALPLAWEPASGSCTELVDGAARRVTFPAIDMPVPKLIGGFRVAGPQLKLEAGQAGTFELEGRTLKVLPFQVVDCSTCPEDGFDGWYELHALLWDATLRKVRFGAFYLSPRHAGQIGLDYMIGLPDVTFGAPPSWFPAEWSKVAANKSAASSDSHVLSLPRSLSRPRAPF